MCVQRSVGEGGYRVTSPFGAIVLQPDKHTGLTVDICELTDRQTG